VLASLLCAGALMACGTSAAPTVDRFDEDRAWKLLEYQVELGPRPAGSPRSRALASYIRKRIPRGRIEPVPGKLQNVVGEIPGKGKAIVLAAHYDTKDLPGFVGANDGAGGTAAVMAIARTLETMKRPKNAPPIRFVFFDGEEATKDTDFYGTGLRGSKHYAKRHAKEIEKLILLDFIADKRLSIPREESSDVAMWKDLRAAARRVGSQSVFPDTTVGQVLDDHTPFLLKRIPAIDLIDFDFKCWHKLCDDLTAVSKTSLDRSGEAVLEYVLTEWRGR
jgi:glutaminyl-peptide cyclotransferase